MEWKFHCGGNPPKWWKSSLRSKGNRIYINNEIYVKNDYKEFSRVHYYCSNCKGRLKKIKVREVEGRGGLCHNEKIKKPSDQIRSVTQSCPTLCDPMNRSTPGLPVHHQLPEFTQTHDHQVSDAIQPSHPLSSPSPPAPNPSQHQSLFQ